jgi:hypothetical protein
MTLLSRQLHRFSTTPVTLLALAIFILFMAVVLPDQAEKAAVYAGEAGSADTSFFYTADDLYRMAEAYGSDGRASYIRSRFTFDLVWPLAYTAFLVTALSWLFRRARPGNPLWQRANLVPVGAMLFDLLENLSASIVMARYPDPAPLAALLASPFTMVKWVLVAASFALLPIGLAAWLVQRRRA